MKWLTLFKKSTRTGFSAGLLLGSMVAYSAVEISNVPLQTGSSVPPNIMFILDDSGSMHFELMPDSIMFSDKRYIFPRANEVYGGNDYSNYVPTVEDGQAYNAFARSFQNNTMYYNPAITYSPWVRADGTLFPNANPQCAWHNPMNTGTCPGNTKSTSTNALARNLTVTNGRYNFNRWYACNSSGSCSYDTQDKDYWPATYFFHNSGSVWNWNNYTKVEIRSSQATYSGHGRVSRTDCANGVCTYQQEIQNFANWYTYYRSRILASRAGIGKAFVNQSEKMRVGFGALNKGSTSIDGVSSSVIVRGVREFSGTNKANFYADLYDRTIPNSGTPLRSALVAAGEYFSRKDSKGPWGLNPGSGNEATLDHITCRQSFTILMTDGYWSQETLSNIGNQDGTNGVLHTRPAGEVGDNYQYIAKAPFSDGASNTLADVAMKYWKTDLRPDLDNRVPTSTINPAFWQHMVTFGVGLGVLGSVDPVTAFAAINSGASVNWPTPPFNSDSSPAKLDDLLHAAVNSRGGYFTADNPDDFATRLERTLTAILDRVASASNLAGTTTSTQADNFVFQGSFNSGEWSGSLQSFNINNPTTPVWSANFPTWNSRNIVFGKKDGTAALFTPANVTADNNALSGKTNLINYLRGDQSRESGDNAEFRRRTSLMGDIANSSPLYVAGPVNRNFQRYNWDGASSYRQFLTDNANRQPVVYVGANDGMLHAFNGSSGMELMAYVPAYMLTEAAKLTDYSKIDYEHRYFVDGSPVAFDAYVGGSWKTLLVGSLGRGGDSLFVIDVTAPGQLSSNGVNQVLWDKRFPELGQSTSRPVITRLNNGKWAIVTGYGYNNSSNKAGLLVIDLETGSVLRKLEAGNQTANGSGQIEGWDANGDGNTDWFFAGDLMGNIWKFDLSSSSVADWKVAYSGQPLFTARDAANKVQPITGGITLSSEPETGYLWINFGTGKMLSEQDPLTSAQNTWYGIRNGVAISGRAQLQQRKIVAEQDGSRVIELGAPNDMVTKRGWYIDLGEQRERIVNRPQLIGNTVVINTITPSDSECNPAGSGWVMAVSPYTGSRLKYNFFDRNRDGQIDAADLITVTGENNPVPVSAIRFDGMPSEPVFFEDRMVVGLADTRIANVEVDLNVLRGRVSWRELLNQ